MTDPNKQGRNPAFFGLMERIEWRLDMLRAEVQANEFDSAEWYKEDVPLLRTAIIMLDAKRRQVKPELGPPLDKRP